MKNLQINIIALLLLFSSAGFAHFSTKGPYGGRVKCMAVCDTMVYVGTYDGGIYRSTNSFLTAWRYVNYTGLTNPVTNALTSIGKKIIAGTPSGIFRSGDIGTTWTAMNSGLTNTNVLSAIKSGSLIFAGTNGGGVFMSADTAVTWLPVNTGLTNMTVTAFAVNGTTLFASTNGGGVFTSTDNGSTWAVFNTGLINMTVTSLIVSGTNIFAGTNTGVFVSDATTVNWALTNTGLTNTIINCLAASGNTVFAGTNLGVFSSPNASPTWAAANNNHADTVTALVIHNNRMVAGTYDKGLFKSSSLVTINWVALNTGFNNLQSYAVYNDGTLVIGATNKGLFVSKDLATTYVRANFGLTDSLHVNCLTFAGTKLYAGTMLGGIFVSSDTGKTWTTANTGLITMNIKKIIANNTHLIAAAANSSVFSSPVAAINWTTMTGITGAQAITALATDGTTTFLGQTGVGVFVSTNNSSWTAFNSGLTNSVVTSLKTKGTDVYVGTIGGGVFKSAISAVAWSPVNTGLPTLNILSLASANQWIVAGFRGGVFSSYDNGTSWSAAGVQQYLPSFSDINNMSFSNASTRLFVTAPNNSLYSQGLTELATGLSENTLTESEISIAPNPNNGNFNVSVKNNLKLNNVSVYDLTGKKVYDKNVNATSVDIQLNCNIGLYFIVVNTDNGNITKKIIIE